MRMKRTLFSIVLLAAFAVQGLYAQATREEIFNDIATTGGVYYADGERRTGQCGERLYRAYQG